MWIPAQREQPQVKEAKSLGKVQEVNLWGSTSGLSVTMKQMPYSFLYVFVSILKGKQTVFSKETNMASPKCSNQGRCECGGRQEVVLGSEELSLLLIQIGIAGSMREVLTWITGCI